MNLSPLHLCLFFSSTLFCVGLIGALSRSNAILVLGRRLSAGLGPRTYRYA